MNHQHHHRVGEAMMRSIPNLHKSLQFNAAFQKNFNALIPLNGCCALDPRSNWFPNICNETLTELEQSCIESEWMSDGWKLSCTHHTPFDFEILFSQGIPNCPLIDLIPPLALIYFPCFFSSFFVFGMVLHCRLRSNLD